MSNQCVHCTDPEVIKEPRRDAFNTANSMLRAATLEYTFEDVMTLACFLLGYREDEE